MKRKSLVPRPFCSGVCQKCRRPENLARRRLCPRCSQYANQDYGIQGACLLSPEALEKASDDFAARAAPESQGGFELRNRATRRVIRLLRQTRPTRRQKQIARLIFLQGKTFLEVADSLRISNGCVENHVKRIRKKLQNRRTRAILSKENTASVSSVDPSNLLLIHSPDPKAGSLTLVESDPEVVTEDDVQEEEKTALRRVCPRCRDRVFVAGRDYQYCMHCLWNSDQD